MSSNPACPIRTNTLSAGDTNFDIVDDKNDGFTVTLKTDPNKVEDTYKYTVTGTALGGAKLDDNGEVELVLKCKSTEVSSFKKTG